MNKRPERDQVIYNQGYRAGLEAAAKELENPMLLELLADIEHERWSGWQKHLHSLCEEGPVMGLVIQHRERRRWERQMGTPYAELSEREKESDRIEARKSLAAISGWFLVLAGKEWSDGQTEESQRLARLPIACVPDDA